MPGIKVKQSKRRNKREMCYDKGGGGAGGKKENGSAGVVARGW